MNEELKKYEPTIKKKHSFNWTPKFEEEIRTDLNKTVIIPIVIQTFEKLGWDLIYKEQTIAEAKRKSDWNRWTEKITVSFDYGKLTIKSVSLGNEMWDNGRNSKRVKLFIHAFQKTEKEYDREAIAELEQEVEKTNNWDDYEIPENLQQPKTRKEPQLWIPIIGGIITSLLLGYIVAFLSVKGIYIIGLFELGVALVMGFVLKQLIKKSNYTIYNHLHYLLIGMILITYVSNQYFQYKIILNENNFQPFSLWEFIQARFKAGLTIKKLNTGWIGLLVSWILQLLITYFVGVLRLSSSLISYLLERVPTEVVDFAYYHFVKDKTEDQVRDELSKMGWTEKQDQEEVFEAIEAIQGATEMNRME
ncbi:hypothetical protein [Algibacter lectus]|uniref:Uncharacterized protein n=1 Tax=Algibacter lectus TaxID=221126 RepID=A0A090V6X6_9FLAO|nr:hypothetical protein [Algibacter lectus]MWW24372.1 hypothetical protein [Algibacter lectus]TDY62391.1 hypothetical protein DFQ06_2228 [Algibacter lectus]GAL60571.1 hypothetical protein JCM19300_3509 [Algibacter lectus]